MAFNSVSIDLHLCELWSAAIDLDWGANYVRPSVSLGSSACQAGLTGISFSNKEIAGPTGVLRQIPTNLP